MTLQQAIESGLPFKHKQYFWWIDPKEIPEWMFLPQYKGFRGDGWITGTQEDLDKQEKEVKRYET